MSFDFLKLGIKISAFLQKMIFFLFSVSRGRHHHDGLGRTPGRGRKSSTSSTGHIAFNKEHYLLATCQFVVHSSVDPTPYLDNPDLLVDWSVVEQVRDKLYGQWIERGNQQARPGNDASGPCLCVY